MCSWFWISIIDSNNCYQSLGWFFFPRKQSVQKHVLNIPMWRGYRDEHNNKNLMQNKDMSEFHTSNNFSLHVFTHVNHSCGPTTRTNDPSIRPDLVQANAMLAYMSPSKSKISFNHFTIPSSMRLDTLPTMSVW
jgi:hypothetical protein